MNRRRQIVGNAGENEACRFLEGEGFRVRERNFRTRFGEIDIVAEKGGEVFLIEVKTRLERSRGSSVEQITPFKLRTLQRMAELYIARNRLEDRPIHLSLVGLDVDRDHTRVTFIPDMVGAL